MTNVGAKILRYAQNDTSQGHVERSLTKAIQTCLKRHDFGIFAPLLAPCLPLSGEVGRLCRLGGVVILHFAFCILHS